MAADKEYLTFCNTSNLDWQFVKLELIRDTKDYNGKKVDRFPYISELLKPDNFAKRNEDGKILGYTYIPEVKIEGQITTKNIEDGLNRMRSIAGVAMNYLEECEKNSKEGNFLGQWEVIYAADSYKLLVDELFIKTSTQLGLKKTPLAYPTRKEVEDTGRMTYFIDIGISLVDLGITIFSGNKTVAEADLFGTKEYIKEELLKHLANEVKDKTLEEYDFGGIIGCLSSLNDLPEKIGKTGTKAAGMLNSSLKDSLKKDVNAHLKLTRKVDFSINDKFKVVIFKKDKQVVIVINDTNLNEGKVLPSTIDLLQLLCSKIKSDFESFSVRFAGYNKGATLALLCNFLMEESYPGRYFFTENPIVLNNYIDFTKEDIFEKYKNPYEIMLGTAKTGFKQLALMTGLLLLTTGGAGILGYATLVGFQTLISAPLELIKKLSLQEKFNLLKNHNFITEKKSPKISGYITDNLYKNNFMPIMTETGYINIKSSHALFLIFDTRNNKYENLDIYPDIAFLPKAPTIIESCRKNKGNVEYLAKAFGELFYHLVDSDGIYEIIGFKKAGLECYDINTIELDKKTLEQLKEAEYMVATMKVTGRLQRSYEKIGNDNFSTYFLNKETIKYTGDLLKITPVKSDYISKEKLDEYIFLPFITDKGSIVEKIQAEYIKNSLRDMVSYFAKEKDYRINLINNSILECLKFFAEEIQNTDSNGSGMKSNIKKNACEYEGYQSIPNKKLFLFSKAIYDDFKKKPGLLKQYYDESYACEEYTQINFINEGQMMYGYGNSSLTTRDKSHIKLLRNNTNIADKFKGVLKTILPSIKVDNKTFLIDESNKWFKEKKLQYKIKARSHNGVIEVDLGKGTYEYKIEFSYNQKKKNKIHYGYDISYGQNNTVNYTRPSVYSPVNGQIMHCKNGRIIIKSKSSKTVSDTGKKVDVYYFHVLEHLIVNSTLSPYYDSKKNGPYFVAVKKGQEIGKMAGIDFGTNMEKYPPHIHYSMFMNNRYFTGSTTTKVVNRSGYAMAKSIDILLNPQKFWDYELEVGGADYSKEQE